jgi:hypothetical protein
MRNLDSLAIAGLVGIGLSIAGLIWTLCLYRISKSPAYLRDVAAHQATVRAADALYSREVQAAKDRHPSSASRH